MNGRRSEEQILIIEDLLTRILFRVRKNLCYAQYVSTVFNNNTALYKQRAKEAYKDLWALLQETRTSPRAIGTSYRELRYFRSAVTSGRQRTVQDLLRSFEIDEEETA